MSVALQVTTVFKKLNHVLFCFCEMLNICFIQLAKHINLKKLKSSFKNKNAVAMSNMSSVHFSKKVNDKPFKMTSLSCDN